MTASSTPSFGRAGRPRKFKFSDLFLWDPSIEIELSGYSISEIANTVSPAALALYRDAMRNKKISIKRAKTVLPQFLEQVGHIWATDALKFFEGEKSLVADFGPWQCHIYASAGRADEALPKPNAIGQHFMSIEEALKEPTRAWRNGKLAYCADLIESSNILKLYAWPAAIGKIRNATSNAQVLAVRVMVMQELMLAFIAAFDAKATADGYAEDSAFDRLFPDLSNANPPHPNALFFDYLAAEANSDQDFARYVSQINKPAKDFDIGSAKRELRRWKRGDSFPSNAALDAMFRNIYGNEAHDENNSSHKNWCLSWQMAAAARRINLMMKFLTPFHSTSDLFLPFDFETTQAWRESRYLHWYRQWLPVLKHGN